MTGLNGTAMPSYADVFDEPDGESIHPGDAWNLVSAIAPQSHGHSPPAPPREARRGPRFSDRRARPRAARATVPGEAIAADKEPLP